MVGCSINVVLILKSSIWQKNEATRKTRRPCWKQQYENFNAFKHRNHLILSFKTGIKSLLVIGKSRLYYSFPESLNVKFFRSLWGGLRNAIHSVKVKKSVGTNNDDKNLAFLTTSGASSTNIINTANPEVRYDNNTKNVSTAIKWDILPENVEHQGVKTTEIGIKVAHQRQGEKFKQTGSQWHSHDSKVTKNIKWDYLGLNLKKLRKKRRGFEFIKIAKFKISKDLDPLLASLEEFKQPKVNEYGPRDSSVKPTTGCDKEENNDAPIIEDWVSDDEDDVEPISKVEKKTVIPTATKKKFIKPEKPVRRARGFNAVSPQHVGFGKPHQTNGASPVLQEILLRFCQEEPKRVSQALRDPAWVKAMQEELLQFKLQKVWILVDLPKGYRAIGTKWVYRNKKDERGIVIKNQARLVAAKDIRKKRDRL
ncbi:putative ribonuclease H-like domain-containing protein [Tanacetum coccineum]|uniref:Ribonuclease H-like domain-containing protein n=1 Tax=Tanacetum coccineum TaxID=301880 RepID=A0ABQ4YT93_9ASTR